MEVYLERVQGSWNDAKGRGHKYADVFSRKRLVSIVKILVKVICELIEKEIKKR